MYEFDENTKSEYIKALQDNDTEELERLKDENYSLIFENGEDYEEILFRLAIENSAVSYIQENIFTVQLNDLDNGSSYLQDCHDDEILSILFSYGAIRVPTYYESFDFAYNTIDDKIISFKRSLQKEVFEKYKKKFFIEDSEVVKMFVDGDDNEFESIYQDLYELGVNVNEEDEIIFEDRVDNGSAIASILESFDYILEFEGTEESFSGKVGIYFYR